MNNMDINIREKFFSDKKTIVLIGLIVLIIGSAFLIINVFAGTSPSACLGTNTQTRHCETCIDITASPSSISVGGSSTLTLYLESRNNGVPAPAWTADCSINNGVLPNTTLSNGSYNYSVSPSNTITYTATCTGVGGTVTDSVTITITNYAPTATNLSVTPLDYCINSLPTRLSWSFSDPDPGDTQGAYQIQVDNNSDFSSPEVNPGKVYSSSGAYTASGFSYKTTYYWRLKVWDNNGAQSSWISGPSFITPLHIYPDPDFTWSPSSPSVDEIVQFCATQEAGICLENVSTCYDINNNPISCSGKTFLWTFPTGTEFATGTSATSKNPRVKFDSTGQKVVSLQITDDVGPCSITKPVGVTFPLPEWEEAAP